MSYAHALVIRDTIGTTGKLKLYGMSSGEQPSGHDDNRYEGRMMMIRDRLERIRERAYELWERAGSPHGQHEEHWKTASKEIDDEHVSKSDTVSIPPSKSGSNESTAPKPTKASSARRATVSAAKETRSSAKASGKSKIQGSAAAKTVMAPGKKIPAGAKRAAPKKK
jgi:hypothetical protein